MSIVCGAIEQLALEFHCLYNKHMIDPDVIPLMNDDELSQYIPLHGDRVRINSFFKGNAMETRAASKKTKLLERLREKVEDRIKIRQKTLTDSGSSDEEKRQTRRPYGNKFATKPTRLIELGWIHKTESGCVQIRKRMGGGTRKVVVNKNSTKWDILDDAKKLFFPDGESGKGPIEDFEFDVWDFRDRIVEDGLTVGIMYNDTKLPLLRFYMATTDKVKSSDETFADINQASTSSQSETFADINQASTSSQSETFAEINQASTNCQSEYSLDESSCQSLDIIDFSPEDLLATAVELTGILPDVNFIDESKSEVIKHNIKIHRGQILKELLVAFKNIDPLKDVVSLEIILPDGKTELAEDSGGVTRDALCEFWNSFYNDCTLGTNFKVPCLRHDYGEIEWNSVGKIIVYGWNASGYFPVQLSLPFIQQSMNGAVSCDIKEAFLKFLPENDSELLRRALEDITSVNEEELLDLLDCHEVKTCPTQKNINRIVTEISHKELIQSCMFVIDCWAPHLRQLRICNIQKMYEDLQPNCRKVLNKLTFPETMSPIEAATSKHLSRFVRELHPVMLANFLRFCTGSDLLICGKIDVTFVDLIGLARRPIAHTCSCLLELPRVYESFPQFRVEFLSILQSNVWVMDII